MRLRTSLAAALGALTLILTLPTSASAATGDFTYSYKGEDGIEHSAKLTNPADGECIDIEGAEEQGADPAYAPVNNTDRIATVYDENDCGGSYWVLNPGRSKADFNVESVEFGTR
ncbi:hypothetical protein [Streptomyces sp. NPDC089919]|uniref:hypothetical protein n=1 Tax=Streptomyces sp. NPDC089919 TaxID=3155188 RepID=UPI00341281F1